MPIQWSKQKESVAYHEAGHRVMASVVGAPPKDISLRWDDKEQAWVGGVRDFAVAETDRELLMLVALAGPWAEIKYRARRCWSTAAFDQAEQVAGLISYLEDPGFEREPSVIFRTDTGAEHLQIDVNAFSDDVDDARRLLGCDDGMIEQLMYRVRAKLDELPVWSAVEAIAKALLKRPELGSGREVMIPSAEAEKILHHVWTPGLVSRGRPGAAR